MLAKDEQARYINTITQLNSGPTPTKYAQLVSYHSDMMAHRMHGGMGPIGRQRFLPWHRDFLLHLEKALQEADPRAFVPYWEWSLDRALPNWIAGFRPTVVIPPVGGMGERTIQVTRSPHNPAGLPTAQQVKSLDSNKRLDYTQFTSILEGYHNTVHGWVGGTMTDISRAAADPVFYMHHAEVDRIWAIWQGRHWNAGKTPTLTGTDPVMDPWNETASQLESIRTLGYSYHR